MYMHNKSSLHLLLHHGLFKCGTYKKLVKSKVLDYWEFKLRTEASFLPSLAFFHPEFMSLASPHKLWTTAGKKSFEVAKARIQLLFLASQYPCGSLSKHWTPENPLGLCTFPDCHHKNLVETPEHVLLRCPAYTTTRKKNITICLKTQDPVSHRLVTSFLLSDSTQKMMQFLLDCSVLPEVISGAQNYGKQIYDDLFYLSRTWCFSVHRERMKRLCKWNFA